MALFYTLSRTDWHGDLLHMNIDTQALAHMRRAQIILANAMYNTDELPVT